MSEAYSRRLRTLAHEVGSELGIRLAEGVYAAVLGPSYETPPKSAICGPSAPTW
jgi:purine-nucleoside phosphorylase